MTENLPTLAEITREHPLLTYGGIGTFDARRKTPAERQTEVAVGREDLAAHEDGVAEVAAWLRQNIAPIKTPGTGSYSFMHLVEKRIGRNVSNGEAIAAAIMPGYPHRYEKGLNVDFGMSRRDVNRLRS